MKAIGKVIKEKKGPQNHVVLKSERGVFFNKPDAVRQAFILHL